MTPSHTVKNGVRYRYYVSKAVLEKRGDAACSVTRAPSAEIEALVTEALHSLDQTNDCSASDGEWVQPQIIRVVITSDAIKVHIAGGQDIAEAKRDGQVLAIPWTPKKLVAVKVVTDSQSGEAPNGTKNRETLLKAIAKAQVWVEELVADRTTIAEIAKREDKGERHIRLLLPLAFSSPVLVEAVAGGAAPKSLTITMLSQQISNIWQTQNGIA